MMDFKHNYDSADKRYMRAALALAEKHIGMAGPNPSVGCVVVRDGSIVGRGWHEYDRLDHAEVRALKIAKDRSVGSTVYVTLEPCCHQGRTAPCADLLIKKRVHRVVAACPDPNPLVAGRGISKLRSKGIRVDVGLMADAAGRIIEPFACSITTGRPFVLSKVGMSLDGKIGTGGKAGRQITSKEGRDYGHSLRLRSDALMVGIGTILSDNPALTYRGEEPRRKPLLRVILDSGLRTPPEARIFDEIDKSPVLIFCQKSYSVERRKKLEDIGAEIVAVPKSRRVLDPEFILRELAEREVQGLLVEGGSRVHWEFISRRIVDRFDFIIAPMILGGEGAIPSVGGKGYASVANAPRFKIRRSFFAGQDLVIEGYPYFSKSIISPWRLS